MKRRSRLAVAGAVLVVLLITGASALAYTVIAPRHQGPGVPGAKGVWEQSLSGYLVSSIAAAPGDPSVLYACAEPAQTGKPANRLTVLRSADGGTSWQDVGSSAGITSICQLAINPNNSSDVYLVTTASSQQFTSIIKHSTDGGHTWNTIQPSLVIPGATSVPFWNLTQVSMVGQQLFGIQTLSVRVMPPQGRKGTIPQPVYNLPRLVTSANGGHTWNVLDQQFTATHQGVGSYAVDPTNARIIYEIVSVPWLPIQPLVPSQGAGVPAYGYNASLYKTTDSGATWRQLLTNLPYATIVQLAARNPRIIYAGGIRRPLPYAAAAPGTQATTPNGNFQLHMSSDGGATWHDVSTPPKNTYIQSWMIGQNGQVYVFSGGVYLQMTVVVGTAIVATQVTIPASTPQSSVPSQKSTHPDIHQPVETPTVPAVQPSIERYDPTTGNWSQIVQPPSQGSLLAVTPSTASGDLLWYMGTASGKAVLYRYAA